jgi:hypothetical protein
MVRRFTFVNAGAQPLTVTDLRASCGCTTPSLPKRTYQPGERGELALEVNTLSQPPGQNRWSVQVAYRCGEYTGQTTLELTARLVTRWFITPAALVLQGTDPPVGTIHISAAGENYEFQARAMQWRKLRTSSPRITAEWAANTEEDTGLVKDSQTRRSGRIVIRVAADCPVGEFAETVTLESGSLQDPEIKIPVTIIREPKRRVSALPARATLVAGGSAVVQLRAADGQPVQIEAIEASLPALTTRWAAGPGNNATVRVGLDRSKWHGEPLTGEVRVRVKGETIAIPVSVQAGDD